LLILSSKINDNIFCGGKHKKILLQKQNIVRLVFENKTKQSLKLVDTRQNKKALLISNWDNNVKKKNISFKKFLQSTTIISILEIIILNIQSITAPLVSHYDSCG
jgi:hypothetical protein